MTLPGGRTAIPAAPEGKLGRRRLAEASLVLAALLVVSRLLGAVLQVAVAALFGASGELDAYLVASSVPQLVTGLYASGATIMLVPLLARSDRTGATEQDTRAMDAALTILVLLVLVVTVAAAAAARPLMSLLGHGFSAETLALTADLFRWFTVFLALSALGSVMMGVLNGRGSFVLPGAASVAQSLIWLAVLIGFADVLGVHALVLGAIAGALTFILVQLPSRALREPRGFQPLLHADRSALREFLVPLGVFGAVFAFAQVNVVGDRFFASTLAPGAVSILDFAGKIHLVLLNVLGYSMVTPAFTRMSAELANGDTRGFRDTVTFAARMMLVTAVPTVVVTTVLRVPLLQVLLERGAFGAADTARAASAMGLMAPAQLASVFTLLLVYALFALRDTKPLLGIAAISMVANLLFDVALYRRLGTDGIALASTLAFVPSLALMAAYLGRRLDGFDWRGLGSLAVRVVLASGSAALAAGATYALLAGSVGAATWQQAMAVMISLVAALVLYVAALVVLRVGEVDRVYAWLRRRVAKGEADEG